MKSAHILSLATCLTLSQAVYKGFNYGALDLNGAVKDQAAFEGEFNAAKNLVGPKVPYTSARLYTSIQGGTTNGPISAIPAAINTNTSLLLGIWASAGQELVNNEIAAIQNAIAQYGSAFTDLIAGISVGSEDIYRITPLGVASNAGTGADPNTIAAYVVQVKQAFPNLGKPVGHVDTYNVWANSSGWTAGLVQVVDFLGVDAYPYYESTKANDVSNGGELFEGDVNETVAIASGKPIWVTETGWPTTGPTQGQGVASVENAEIYYQQVACDLFRDGVNTWWYTLQDSEANPSVPSFGLVGAGTPPPTTPKYNIRSPPKRVTRARAAAQKEDILSGPPRKPASKVQKSTASRKTKEQQEKEQPMQTVQDEQQEAIKPATKTVARTAAAKTGTLAVAPRRRIKVTPLNPPQAEQTAPVKQPATKAKKPSTRRKAASKEEDKEEEVPSSEAQQPTHTQAKAHTRSTKAKQTEKKAVVAKPSDAPATTTRSRPKRTAKEPAETIQTASETPAQAEEPARTTRLTRTRAASSTKSLPRPVTESKAKLTKKVTFEDVPNDDKENHPVPARKAPAKKETPVTGMRAKPVRKPSGVTKKSSTTASRATRSRSDKPAARVLTPKKISPVNRPATADASDDDDDDDELCCAKTPVRDLSLSPRRNPALAAALSPVQKLDLTQSLVARSPVRPIESGMMSPARRPPSPQKEATVESPLKESPKRGNLTLVFPTASQMGSVPAALVPPTRFNLLQSPKRVQLDASAFSNSAMKPKQSPLKASLLGSPARRLASPKKPTDTPAGGHAEVTVTSHFRSSVSPERSGRVYRMSDEELAEELVNDMDFDQSVLCVNSPLKVMKPVLFEEEKEAPAALPAVDIADMDAEDTSVLSNEVVSPSIKAAEARFRSASTPSEESEDELAGEKTPVRHLGGFRSSLMEDESRSRLSTGIPAITNHNIGFTPLAAQMTGWHAASPDKKSTVRKTFESQHLFSPIAAMHVDGQVVISRQSTPQQKTPRFKVSSLRRRSLAPTVIRSPEKTSFFEDQMAGFEAEHGDEEAATAESDMNELLNNEEIMTGPPQLGIRLEEEGSEGEDDTDAALDENDDANGELTTDLIKFTNASNTAMVDFEELAKEAQEMHEESMMVAENGEEEDYGDENVAPLQDMEVTEMIGHTAAHEHFAEFPQCHDEQATEHGEDAMETIEQASEASEAAEVTEGKTADSELGLCTPVQQDFSMPRFIHTVVSKVPLRPEGQVSPVKVARKRARSLSNAAQESTPKRAALILVPMALSGAATPSPDRRVRSAAPSPAVTTPGQISFAVHDFGDSTLDSINVSEEDMMDFEVGNPAIAPPSSAKSAKTVQTSTATPVRTPLRQLGRGILAGTVVYVEVRTGEGADASGVYIDLLTQMGAKCVKEWRWNPRSSMNAEEATAGPKVGITHVVYKDGGKRTLEKVRDATGEVLCVGVRWVLDCEREQKWLDETPYIVDHAIFPRGGSRRRKSMEPSRLSNVNGTVSAKGGRRTSSAEFLTDAMRQDLIKTPVSNFSLSAAADDGESEISSTYNSPTTTMNVRNASAGFETPPELKNWDPATSATPMAPKTPAQPNFRRDNEGPGAAGLKSAPPKQLGEKLFDERAAAIGQICSTASMTANLAQCQLLARKAVAQGAKALFLPEASDYIASSAAESVSLFKPVAESAFVLGLQETARQHSLRINKLHMFDIDLRADGGPRLKESDSVEPGNAIEPPYRLQVDGTNTNASTNTTDNGINININIGSLICFDLRFAEPAIALRRLGAQVLVYPSAFTVATGKAGHWETLLRARAIETQSYVLAAAQCGRHNARRVSYGDALAVGPDGVVLGRLGRVEDEQHERGEGEGEGGNATREPQLLTVDIDLDVVARTRRGIPLIRREDVYGRI
ncbi:hypothetical protein DV738_g2616, partial [Chaetothyriales sp. CBS 135597]